jgi:hypothetical protein
MAKIISPTATGARQICGTSNIQPKIFSGWTCRRVKPRGARRILFLILKSEPGQQVWVFLLRGVR